MNIILNGSDLIIDHLEPGSGQRNPLFLQLPPTDHVNPGTVTNYLQWIPSFDNGCESLSSIEFSLQKLNVSSLVQEILPT